MGNTSVACGDDRSGAQAVPQPQQQQYGQMNGGVAPNNPPLQNISNVLVQPQAQPISNQQQFPYQQQQQYPQQPQQFYNPQQQQQFQQPPQPMMPMPPQSQCHQFGASPEASFSGIRMTRASSMHPNAMPDQTRLQRATSTAPREFAQANPYSTQTNPFWSPNQPSVDPQTGAMQTPRSQRTMSGLGGGGGDSDEQIVPTEQEQMMLNNADRIEKLKAAFRQHDLNGDGVLTVDEMDGVLKSMYTPSEEEIQVVIRAMDKNRDGSISFQEFLDGMRNINPLHAANPKGQQRLKQLFDKYDSDGSGVIERNEYVPLVRDLLTIDSDTRRKAFAIFDANRDGFVTFDEFMKVAPKLQLITFKNQYRRHVTKLVQIA